MTNIQFLERNLHNIGERRAPKTAVAISEVSGDFAKNGRFGSGAHMFHEREKVKAHFDECMNEMTRFYIGFCKSEGLPLERHLDCLSKVGSKVADEWAALMQDKATYELHAM